MAHSKLKNQIFNIGSGNTVSVNKITELLECDKVFIPKRPGEPDCTFAKIDKITNLTDWMPKISIEEGIKKLINNIDYWKNAPVWTPSTIEKETKDWFRYLGKKEI